MTDDFLFIPRVLFIFLIVSLRAGCTILVSNIFTVTYLPQETHNELWNAVLNVLWGSQFLGRPLLLLLLVRNSPSLPRTLWRGQYGQPVKIVLFD